MSWELDAMVNTRRMAETQHRAERARLAREAAQRRKHDRRHPVTVEFQLAQEPEPIDRTGSSAA